MAPACALLLLAVGAVSGVPARAASDVEVLYAGSLVNLMERSVGPAFDRASGDRFQGFAAGSRLLAHQITARLRQADVFVSAAPAVNASLMGAAHGARAAWYVTFAASPLVVGYDPMSRFAQAFASRPWYRVLMQPGIRIGRTDPRLDPKGALTVALMRAAQRYYHVPGLARRVLGASGNPAQVLPEATLIGRLQSGQIDAGFFYSTETVAAGIPAIRLPGRITPRALYTITVLRRAPHPRAAIDFAAFLLGPQGRRLMSAQGLTVLTPKLTGRLASVPPRLRGLLGHSAG